MMINQQSWGYNVSGQTGIKSVENDSQMFLKHDEKPPANLGGRSDKFPSKTNWPHLKDLKPQPL
jgi:hypothetical protein